MALVLGNSDYDVAQYLPNARRDAEDVAASLRNLGFQVTDGFDLSQQDMLSRVNTFMSRIRDDDIVLIYFSGHGIQFGAENYLLPRDAAGTTPEEVGASSVKLQDLMQQLAGRSGPNLIFLDACRNNPFQSRSLNPSADRGAMGLARVKARVGTYIAFSTEPGNVALDGNGRNSPFTGALLRHLEQTTDDIHELMRKVRLDVVEGTNQSQIPWENSSLVQRVYLGQDASTQPAQQFQEPVVSAVATQEPLTHQVSGLNPQGDGFLALRSGPTTSGRMLRKMTEGTELAVLDQSGTWFNVKTIDGVEGWAHSNWIRFQGVSQSRTSAPKTCDSLWHDRNAIFARNGYCFQGARGRAAFSNTGCLQGVPAGEIRLTQSERSQVESIVLQEKAMGCR